MSEEEVIMWSELRELRKHGLHFRRQYPKGRYVADFACLRAKIVVEVDGEQHFHGNAPQRDAVRDRYFEAEGFQTLRYTTSEVRRELHAVIDDILARATVRKNVLGNRDA